VLAVVVAAIVLASTTLSAIRTNRTIPVDPGGTGIITTVAGTGERGLSGDGGPATNAQLTHPADLGFDAAGNLYILQYFPAQVRKVDPSGVITTVFAGETGHTQIGTQESATGMAVDAAGTIYVALNEQNRVLRVDPSGDFSTVAGTGRTGFSGDGGPAVEAKLRHIWDVALDAEGNLYISADNRIRMVDTSGIITTIAGTAVPGFSGDQGPAAAAQLDSPHGIAVDPEGNVVLIDAQNQRIRRIDAQGVITTIGGNGQVGFSGDGGPATDARINTPEQLWVDDEGNIYIADTNNRRVRRIGADGVITTVAGSGRQSSVGDGGPAVEAGLSRIGGVAVGPDNALYIADFAHEKVRRVTL
jgi:internalin A